MAAGALSGTFDFDHGPDRGGTDSVKYDARAAHFGRPDVTPLWVADMDFATAPCVAAAVAARAAHPIYSYTLPPDALFAAIAAWHSHYGHWSPAADDIVLVPGTLPALATLIAATTQPGDGVIVQPPVYGHFMTSIETAGRRVVMNPLKETDGHYSIDFEQLQRVASDARMLLLCNPHNPVGRVWSKDELRALLDIARRHDLVVFSDDIHADLSFSATHFVPLATLATPDDAVITALSPGKTFNTQGLALTALVIPNPTLRERARRELVARSLDDLNPFSLVAAAAAWQDGGPWRDALVAYLEATRDAVVVDIHERLAPLRATSPDAGYLLWLDARGLHLDDAALRQFFIDDCGLGLNPGRDYGPGGAGFMRLNFGAPRARIMAALDAIEVALHRRGWR